MTFMNQWRHLTIKEIESQVRELWISGTLTENAIEALLTDTRLGVKRLGQRLVKELARTEEEKHRYEEMKRYEMEARSLGFPLVAGVDEAGRGPLAGPVVAAAVILPESVFIPGIDDSKKLTPKKRDALFEVISSKCISMATGLVEPGDIDNMNILNATSQAMRKAVEALEPPADFAIVDGNFLPQLSIPGRALVSADALSISVAASSIIAKVTRDRIMVDLDALYPEYGFAKHKGYGTPEHIVAIREHGLCPIHRKSFCSSLRQLSLDIP